MDWAINFGTHVLFEEFNEDRLGREKRILGTKQTTDGTQDSKLGEGDVVYYKSHHLSKAHQGFHAGFAPKWWRSVKLLQRVGKGVFLTDQVSARKVHVSYLKRT